MEYVNASGKPLDLDALRAASKPRKTSRASKDVYHKGWLATGFPPQQLRDAKAQHEAAVAKAAASGRSMLPWDEDRYMRGARPTKIRVRPYETEAAARDAAALAEASDWKGCTYTPVTKGSAS